MTLESGTTRDENLRTVPARIVLPVSAGMTLVIAVGGSFYSLPPLLVAVEFFATILAIFLLGSTRIRMDKNVVSYGSLPIILATFWSTWWPTSSLRAQVTEEGMGALWKVIRGSLFTLGGLERLIHAETLLFLFGLTIFVALVGQSRLLESTAMMILRLTHGRVLPTVLLVATIVALLSGILDGVSMIGLTIRVGIVILLMARVSQETLIFWVILSVILTTVCGTWLAYGEPPNLIMKSNLGLSNRFFLLWCAPLALVSLGICGLLIRSRLSGKRIDISRLDLIERRIADIRFFQAVQFGAVVDPLDLLEQYRPLLGTAGHAVEVKMRQGHHLLEAIHLAEVDPATMNKMTRSFVGEELAPEMVAYYRAMVNHSKAEGMRSQAEQAAAAIEEILAPYRRLRHVSQFWAVLSFFPFVGLLLAHAQWQEAIPLFIAPLAGAMIALIGVARYPRMRALAFHEAKHECMEYLFLLPLFLEITLLTHLGFFAILKEWIMTGTDAMGVASVAAIQYLAAVALSALLDNNVVADFAARAIEGLNERYPALLPLFPYTTAQILGYGVGGSLTHIGSAQSIVAYTFITRTLNPKFTPFDWVRAVCGIVVALSAAILLIQTVRLLLPLRG